MSNPSQAADDEPGNCPSCHTMLVIDPSILLGDAVCPKCGRLLSFVQFSNKALIFDQTNTTLRERLTDFLSLRLQVEPSQITNHAGLLKQFELDSLDQVELIMEFEEEFG